jgi:hypothetical protein
MGTTNGPQNTATHGKVGHNIMLYKEQLHEMCSRGDVERNRNATIASSEAADRRSYF